MAATQTRTLADLKDLAIATGSGAPEPEGATREPKRDAFGRSYATGRRKDAVARVWVRPGRGAAMSWKARRSCGPAWLVSAAGPPGEPSVTRCDGRRVASTA